MTTFFYYQWLCAVVISAFCTAIINVPIFINHRLENAAAVFGVALYLCFWLLSLPTLTEKTNAQKFAVLKFFWLMSAGIFLIFAIVLRVQPFNFFWAMKIFLGVSVAFFASYYLARLTSRFYYLIQIGVLGVIPFTVWALQQFRWQYFGK